MFRLSVFSKTDIFNFLIAVALVFYSLFFQEKSDQVRTEKITAVLESKPYIERFGGDFEYYNLVIKVVGYENEFKVSWCPLQALNKKYLVNMFSGDEVELIIQSDSPTSVWGITHDHKSLIDEKKLESCFDNRWFKNVVLLLIASIFLLLPVVKYFRRKYKV